jgi:hypothetical protein
MNPMKNLIFWLVNSPCSTGFAVPVENSPSIWSRHQLRDLPIRKAARLGLAEPIAPSRGPGGGPGRIMADRNPNKQNGISMGNS